MQIEKRSRYRDSNRNPWNNTIRIDHRTAARLSAIAQRLEVNKSEILSQIVEAAINADETWTAIAEGAVQPMERDLPCNRPTLEQRDGPDWRHVDLTLSKGWEQATDTYQH